MPKGGYGRRGMGAAPLPQRLALEKAEKRSDGVVHIIEAVCFMPEEEGFSERNMYIYQHVPKPNLKFSANETSTGEPP